MIVANKRHNVSYKHCIPPITSYNDAYNCSLSVNHSILSLAYKSPNTGNLIRHYLHATPQWITPLRVSIEKTLHDKGWNLMIPLINWRIKRP